MAKKKIGLTWSNSIKAFETFLPSIQLINNPREVKLYDLIIFPGGEDVDPAKYNEPNLHCGLINRRRDERESEMFSYAYELNKQVIGICRGSQFLNVMCGGSLYQDLLEQANRSHPQHHPLEFLDKNDPFYKFFGNKNVVSTHHQAIKSMARSNYLIATYNDIPEITRMNGNHSLYTLQFHPEFEYGNEDFFKFISEEW